MLVGNLDLSIACEICACKNSVVLFKANGINVLECEDCKHHFADFEPTLSKSNDIYGDNYFNGGKDGYPDYLVNKDILIKRGEKYADIIGKFQKPGKILDVGSAAGFILKGFENKGWKGLGVEPNQSMVTYARENLKLKC